MTQSDDFSQDPLTTPPPERDSTTSAVLLRLALLALGAGAIVGVSAAFLSPLKKPAAPVAVIEVPAEVAQTDAGGAEALPPEPQDPAETLREAQKAVETLETQLAAREAELTDVARAAGIEGAFTSATDLTEEVATTRANLEAARAVRDRLKTDLKLALQEVEAQADASRAARAQVSVYREASVRSQWEAFTAKTKTELCDHGTRRAVDKCQHALDEYFTEARYDRYAACIHDGGATPVLLGTPRGDSVPENAEPIGSRALLAPRDWYVLYCDPKLPERRLEPEQMSAAD